MQLATMAVHPRACGELNLLKSDRFTPRVGKLFGEVYRGGSSPRVRGTQRLLPSRQNASRRFIPARAGNSFKHDGMSVSTLRQPVHPRACGELGRPTKALEQPKLPDRFIPARAGNSAARMTRGPTALSEAVHPRACGELFRKLIAPWPATAAVHPRACGELAGTVAHSRSSLAIGSSPRVRGTPFLQGPDNKGFFRCQRAHQLILLCSWVACEIAQTGKS